MEQPITVRRPPSLAPGALFGCYQILEPLGVGGMGEVYRATDIRLGRDVAIKTILSEQCARADSLRRFEQEARSASSLNHPNIVTIYELGQVNGTHYIAMEFVGGTTLRKLLAAGPLSLHQVLELAAQLADAMAKAHEIGVVHRDLKPENIIVSSEGVPKIVDFGLAKLIAAPASHGAEDPTAVLPPTEPGALLGTVGYMAPEQANGQEVDFRSDLFSFGSVLYEMLAARPAFRGSTPAETLAAILRDQPPSIVSLNPQVPAPLDWIVERCLAKDPKQRYASTRDLARDLAALRDRLAEMPARPSQPRFNNLPPQRTAFLGRDRERVALRELAMRDDVRLVTLTGPGGIGKTRLALEVAGEIAEHFAGGICFVPLSATADPGLLFPTIAQAMGLRSSGNQPPVESLKEHLHSLHGPMLLLLDNFEHLVSAAPLLSDLLSIGRMLKVVVTSQAALHIYGEHEFPVPPLTLPDLRRLPPLEVLSALPAIALFVERAQAVKRDFVLTETNAPAVAAICARLDGLPLAIELAAARVKLLSPSAMQARLESSLSLLTGGACDLPSRQQTLRATIDWSYGLLNSAEQKLFRRLSVFIGGCTLEGVEAVCNTRSDLGLDLLDGMTSMLDKSLAQQMEDMEGGVRFVMLATIREYGLERLATSGDEAATRQAHAAYCIVLAEERAEEDAARTERLERFELEHDNFRAALDWLTRSENAEWGLRLGAALFRFWETREHLSEGHDRLARLLALPAASSFPKLHARVLFAAGVLAGEQGDCSSAQRLLEASLEVSQSRRDQHGVAVALNALAVSARDRGELSLASSLLEQSLAIWRQLSDPLAIARALSNLANVAKLQADYARASSLYDECLALFRQIDDRPGIAWSLNYQGDVARERGDLEAAKKLYEESLAAFRQLGDGWGIASSLSDLGDLSRNQRRFAEAQRLYAQSIHTFQALGHKRGVAHVLERLAACIAVQEQAEFALTIAGAAAALRQRLGAPLTRLEQAKLEQTLTQARQTLGTAAGTAAWMAGFTAPLEQTLAQALERCEQQASGTPNTA